MSGQHSSIDLGLSQCLLPASAGEHLNLESSS